MHCLPVFVLLEGDLCLIRSANAGQGHGGRGAKGEFLFLTRNEGPSATSWTAFGSSTKAKEAMAPPFALKFRVHTAAIEAKNLIDVRLLGASCAVWV